MTQPSIAIVVNPERSDELHNLLDALGVSRSDVDVLEPDDADGLESAVSDVVGRIDVVAAIGGDGTQRIVASVLKGSRTALAVVPGGTVNLLARVIGTSSVERAAAAIQSGRRRTIDTGAVDGETFVLQASTGYDAAVIRSVDDSAKRWGRLGYFVTGLRELRAHRPRTVEVIVDGERFFQGRALTVMVTNVGERGSPDLTVARRSAFDDGQLDVVVQRCDTAWGMARTIWALMRDRDPNSDDLVLGHGRSIDVRWSVPVAAQRDGDSTGMVTETHHEVAAGSLIVCVPG